MIANEELNFSPQHISIETIMLMLFFLQIRIVATHLLCPVTQRGMPIFFIMCKYYCLNTIKNKDPILKMV